MKSCDAIVFSAHLGTNKENIGDVLSARAIANLGGYNKVNFYTLPQDIGLSKDLNIIYGGGGIIRPEFFKRGVYKDFLLRSKQKQYSIYGVGLNTDILGSEFSDKDFAALKIWIGSAQGISVRDLATKKFIKNHIGIDCRLAPCPTYNFLKKIKIVLPKKIYSIGIVISFGHTKTYLYYLKDIERMLKKIVELFGDDKILIICHDKKDYEHSLDKFPNVDSLYPKTFEEVKKVYMQCESIISFRGHGVIFAAANNLPCSPVVICDKLDTLYNYHYNDISLGLNFDIDSHSKHLAKKVLPININTK